MERNSHTQKTPQTVDEHRGGMGLSGLVMSNGVAAGDTRRLRRRLSPALLKYAV
jgi:hypothetical protein